MRPQALDRGEEGAPAPSPRPLVLTVTPNPSIDLLFETDRLVWEDANRTASPRRRAGGQGINVVRALRALGADSVAIALLGGPAGAELERLLAAEGQPLVRVEAEGDTRVFVAARERETGRSLLLNPRGPASSAISAEALLQAAGDVVAARSPLWVAGCGSVPPGLPTDTYARLAAAARRAGSRFVADCDGDLLRLAVAAGCDLLVPNQHEAERLAGRRIDGVPAAADVARSLLEEGAEIVLITLGPAGAVCADPRGCWHAATPPERAGSAVGAGDALLAAVLLGIEEGAGPPELARRGVAAGAAVLKSEGGDLLTVEEYRRQLERTEVREVG